jgi:1,4-alpha-glucan branching enzyme
MLTAHDLRLFHKGRLYDAYDKLGAHCCDVDGAAGVRFATWAPNADSASVVGDFNGWDGRRHLMQRADASGVWQLFVPDLRAGAQYKFEMRHARSGRTVIKTDPYARAFPEPTNTNAVVVAPATFLWSDDGWLERRSGWSWQREPLNVYEVHLSSWRPSQSGGGLRYAELALELANHARDLHFTHVELMPIFEHPLMESLGYLVTGYYAPTSRFGTPDEFRAFVDVLHHNGVGVILDWVPLHFPRDEWGLVEFDGGPLYERDDPAMAEHPHWRTLIFNYGRAEVRNFLLSNALYWLREFHVDGLRVDAVSSMLYLDDARDGSAWKRNPLGGRENLPAVKFLRELNQHLHELTPHTFTVAEESTAWPKVSESPKRGGLGFAMKWNMGWANDTLAYMRRSWVERRANHRDLTFGRMYAHTEKFVLSLSHDEVMSARGSLFEQMYGDDEHKFAGMRLLFAYQLTYPGKKLNFMGNEFAELHGWDVSRPLDWQLSRSAQHRGVMAALRDLNALYAALPALHAAEFDPDSFQWLEPDDAERSTLAFRRSFGAQSLIVALNFSAEAHGHYVTGVPAGGSYRMLFNSDAPLYRGDAGDASSTEVVLEAIAQPHKSFSYRLEMKLPALSGLIFERVER